MKHFRETSAVKSTSHGMDNIQLPVILYSLCTVYNTIWRLSATLLLKISANRNRSKFRSSFTENLPRHSFQKNIVNIIQNVSVKRSNRFDNVHNDRMLICVWIPVRHGVHLLNHVSICARLFVCAIASQRSLHPWPWKPVLHGSVFNFKMMGKFVDQSNPEMSNPGKSPASCVHCSSWLHTCLPQGLLLRKYDVTSLS